MYRNSSSQRPYQRVFASLLALAPLVLAAEQSAFAESAKKAEDNTKSAEQKTLPPDMVAASYDGKKITIAELDKDIDSKPNLAFIAKQVKSEKERNDLRVAAAHTMINRALLLEEAKHSGLISEDEVKASVDGVIQHYGGKEKLSEVLKGMRTTYEKFTGDIGDDFRLQSYIDKAVLKEIKTSEEEARQAYDKDPKKFATQPQVHARHILLKLPKDASAEQDKETRTKIEGIATELQQPGATFEELAKKYSQDGSAQRGGDLGFFPETAMVPEFGKVAFSLAKGQVSPPVRTEFGYHLIKVEDKRDGGTPSFDTAKGNIQKALTDEKRKAAIASKLDDLKKKAKVMVFLSQPDAPNPEAPAPKS